MKIFNNFNTELQNREMQEVITKYGEDHVLLIERNGWYWIIKGLIPGFFYIIFPFFLLFMLSYAFSFNDILVYISFFIWIIILLFVFKYFLNIYLHYKMDFTIVTPDEIITYSQKGILDSSYKSIPIKKLRSVQSYRSGILGNIFGFGDVIFLSDGSAELIQPKPGDDMGAGKVVLTYVSKPNLVKKKIMNLCNKIPIDQVIEND